jgi:hypothetical protein
VKFNQQQFSELCMGVAGECLQVGAAEKRFEQPVIGRGIGRQCGQILFELKIDRFELPI